MSVTEKVYGEFTQEELDWQYNNRERVPTSVEIMAEYAIRGEKFIATAPHAFDLPFGDTPAEVIDVYPASNGDTNTPVMIYFHGGYWFSRHKDDFRFLAEGFAPAGAMVVVVNYALIPDVDMAELIRQCRASIAWTYENAATYGGNPDNLYIAGHSAGGHITAMMFATDWSDWNVPTSAIKGGFAISGLYDLEPIRLNYMNPTLGFTEETVADFSPLHLTPTVNSPIVFAVGGAETPEFKRHNTLLVSPWARAGVPCEEVVVPEMNHFTVLNDFATAGHTLNKKMHKLMGL